jgi:hypothetical protein
LITVVNTRLTEVLVDNSGEHHVDRGSS